ncbi:MAG: hypothetical protein KGL39_09505 [Patescibacteria group bacterium]|nr:hypothetical protein [Patescibacteria group bacterium]
MAGPGAPEAGFAGVNDDPTQDAGPQPSGYEAPQGDHEPENPDPNEEKVVQHWWREWDAARKFDENFRKQVAIDRKYAAGTSDLTWAVTTNLIGSDIDTLTALLYARDPDVRVKKAAQVDWTAPIPLDGGAMQQDTLEMFARTLQIVISRLWKKGKLRHRCKKGVRSTLSTAEFWLKANMVAEKTPMPQVEAALNDLRSTMERLRAQEELLEDPDFSDPDTQAARKEEIQNQIEALETKLERAINKMFVMDFVRTENMQVSTDVDSIEDYLDAEWCANETFMPKDKALARFQRLTPEDLKGAEVFYQSAPKQETTRDGDQVSPQGFVTAESALAFTTSPGEGQEKPYLHVVELWDRVGRVVRTMIEGVKKWAVEPYEPPYPTSRFYPYFYVAFFEVDGKRHAQSLAWRQYKLQDEYSTARSNFRLTRERSIPGILVNASQLNPEETRKLENAKHQEITALNLTDPEQPVANAFAAKPVAAIDMRVFDTTAITNDMERVSGVQQALTAVAQGPGNPQTATEASIQQQGTMARTTSDRDALEWMLSDLALYTAEQALQCFTPQDAQRWAGAAAVWPPGMSIEDLFTLVEVDIQAGTTGKPGMHANQATWVQALPLIQKAQMDMQQALAVGNRPMAMAIRSLVQETLRRFGVDVDLDDYLPLVPPPNSPGSGAMPPPVPAKVSIALKGELDPQTSAELAQPDLQRDQIARPPLPPPGAGPAPGSTPGAAGPVPGGAPPGPPAAAPPAPPQ